MKRITRWMVPAVVGLAFLPGSAAASPPCLAKFALDFTVERGLRGASTHSSSHSDWCHRAVSSW
jgi:hypothetical protein